MDSLEALQSLGMGHMVDDLVKAMVLVSEAVRETHKPGTVTVKLKISPTGNPDAVAIAEEVKRGDPSRPPFGAVFFVIGDGLLHAQDPRQGRLDDLRAVESQQEMRTMEAPARLHREVGS